MAKCNDANALGGFLARLEHSGMKIEANLDKLKANEMIGYTGHASQIQKKGLPEFGEGTKAEEKGLKAAYGKLPIGQTTPYLKDPLTLFGEDVVRPIMDAGHEWRKAVIAQKADAKTAKAMWNEMVVPVAKKQRGSYEAATEFPNNAFNEYIDDVIAGHEVFGGESNPLDITAKNAAGYFTDASPMIAGLDFLEVMVKGNTIYKPLAFIKGTAKALVKGKGFGRVKELEDMGLYGFEAREQTKFNRVMKMVNPQTYSQNFLINASAYMGDFTGTNEQAMLEAIRKIGFFKEVGNTPAYLRKGSANITWARYSTEAAKFYIDIHANIGRSLKAGDMKSFANSVGTVALLHGTLYVLGGHGANLPPGVQKVIDLSLGVDSEDQWQGVIAESFNLDVGEKLKMGTSTYGLAWSALNGMLSKSPSIINKLERGEKSEAYATAIELAHFLGATQIRNPLMTKTAKNLMRVSIDFFEDEMDTKEKIELFTGKNTVID